MPRSVVAISLEAIPLKIPSNKGLFIFEISATNFRRAFLRLLRFIKRRAKDVKVLVHVKWPVCSHAKVNRTSLGESAYLVITCATDLHYGAGQFLRGFCYWCNFDLHKMDCNITIMLFMNHLCDSAECYSDRQIMHLHTYVRVTYVRFRYNDTDVAYVTGIALPSTSEQERKREIRIVEYSYVQFSGWCTSLFVSFVVRISQYVRAI